MYKVLVYCCITNGYDELLSPEIIEDNVRYICYTDCSSIVHYPWEYFPVESMGLNNKDINRYYKIKMPDIVSEYDYSIYVDSSIKITGKLIDLIKEISNIDGGLFVYEHPKRSCVYQEAVACSYYGKASVFDLVRQMRKYARVNFPVNMGLFECGVIIRKNHVAVMHLMNDWWGEYCNYSKRDQLSLPYVAWRNNFKISSLGSSDFRFSQKYFRLYKNHHGGGKRFSFRRVFNIIIGSVFGYRRLFLIKYDNKFNL